MARLYQQEDYPMNLLHELLGNSIAILPADFEMSLEYVLRKMESKPEYYRGIQMVRMRYEGKQTLEEISSVYGVTRERVRQMIAKMLRHLRHPSRLEYIRYGLDGIIDRHSQLAHQKGYRLGFNDGKEAAMCGDPTYDVTVERLNPTLEEMDLSVRSFHCLKRAGINNARDIYKLDYAQITHIRNLGRKSYEEIVSKMEELGYNTEKLKPGVVHA